ncbi:MAG: hypothetical protein JSS64_13755 [Bacteroidetes bacterium]|nr:hypothetical protein [Bacteroidota bacterium]
MRYILLHVETIIITYDGSIPMSHFLKKFFSTKPKLGSRDRKIISEMIYCWYRASKGFPDMLTFEEKLRASLFVCDTSVPQILFFLPEEWKNAKQKSWNDRLDFLFKQGIHYYLDHLLVENIDFSKGMSQSAWLKSMFRQPAFFVRLRNSSNRVIEILNREQINYTEVSENCFALPMGLAVDKLLPTNSYVVQDASSQLTGKYFKAKEGERWWDCCSGAGGKSLLLSDQQPNVSLTVSDKRASILNNLFERFKLYNLPLPKRIQVDVTKKDELLKALPNQHFDNIICDVPCSGSGTWSRTPEQLFFFNTENLIAFQFLQKTIVQNALSFLKVDGRLVYITCSVFQQENEAIIQSICADEKVEILETELINGIENKADSMFVSVLKKIG